MFAKHIVAPLVLASAIVVLACDHQSPTAPSPSPSPVPAEPAPVADLWNLTVRMTAATGGECVGETMQAQMGIPQTYTLAVTWRGSRADVALKSTSGDYDCTFPNATVEGDSFQTFGVGGFMSCRTSGIVRSFACSNGASRDLLRFGEDIFGQISGDEITGEWDVTWIVMEVGGDLVGGTNFPDLQTKMEYTGSRQ